MSNESTKIKHSKRHQQKWNHIHKQIAIGQCYNVKPKFIHQLNKKTIMRCSNPNCILCGNPRKMFNQKTKQEIIFDQENFYD